MKDLGITKGEWVLGDEKYYNGNKAFEVWYGNDGECVAEVVHKIEDAKLIADAGTTANKCGLLPSELLEQRDEMLELFENIVEYWNGDKNDKAMFDALNHIIYESEQLIQKITKP